MPDGERREGFSFGSQNENCYALQWSSDLLINDKRTSQRIAALVVNGVGQFRDPDDLPGLAHLMEHMLFPTTMTQNLVNEEI